MLCLEWDGITLSNKIMKLIRKWSEERGRGGGWTDKSSIDRVGEVKTKSRILPWIWVGWFTCCVRLWSKKIR